MYEYIYPPPRMLKGAEPTGNPGELVSKLLVFPLIKENQMEKNMEHEMETGVR